MQRPGAVLGFGGLDQTRRYAEPEPWTQVTMDNEVALNRLGPLGHQSVLQVELDKIRSNLWRATILYMLPIGLLVSASTIL